MTSIKKLIDNNMFVYAAAIASVALVIFFTNSSKDLSSSFLRFALDCAPDNYTLNKLKANG